MPQFLLQRDSSLQNCLNLLRALWQHKHEQVYSILRELPWSETVKPLVQQYEGRVYGPTCVSTPS